MWHPMQMRFRPVFQGATVTLSGLFPSHLERPGGFRIEGIPVEARSLLGMS